MSSVSQSVLRSVFENSIGWMLNEAEPVGIGTRTVDKGPVISAKNDALTASLGPDTPYVLPEVFNTISMQPGAGGLKASRTITIKRDRNILCVPATSHASELEMAAHGALTRTQAAMAIDLLWWSASVKVDGGSLPLSKVVLEGVGVNIPALHPAINESPALGYTVGPRTLSSVVQYAVVPANSLAVGPHTIEMYAYTSGANSLKEIPYEVSVRYNVVIIP